MKTDFKTILSLFPEIRSYFSTIQIGDVSGLDIINFEVDSDAFYHMLRSNSVTEVKDLTMVIRRGFTINDVQYQSMKDFAENFAIPAGDKMVFPFNHDNVMKKIKDCSVIGLIAEKIFDNNCEVIRKMSRQVFDRSSMLIVDKIGSTDLSMDQLKIDFENMSVEYTSKADSFKIPKMVDLYTKFKGQEKELDKTLIEMVFPS